MSNPKHETPLAAWLRSATPEERDRLATLAGTETNYLYQLAACRREPKVGLALRIEVATEELQRDGLERITVEQLATMCAVKGF
jgi:hypothetical protein